MGHDFESLVLNKCESCKKCKEFPTSYWSEIQEETCPVIGVLFLKREECMKKVRQAKEELLSLQVLKSKTTSQTKLENYIQDENRLNSIIQKFVDFGANDW